MSFGQNFASPGQAQLEFPGCFGAICLVQSENVLEVEYTYKDWRGNGFSGRNGSRKSNDRLDFKDLQVLRKAQSDSFSLNILTTSWSRTNGQNHISRGPGVTYWFSGRSLIDKSGQVIAERSQECWENQFAIRLKLEPFG
jgi:hypothetical protein